MIDSEDRFDLARFVDAQEGVYGRVLSELQMGGKHSHWMWFIFPQIDGLGRSPTARRFAIKSAEEAASYLDHPILGPRLVECSGCLLDIEGRTVSQIFGFPDDAKLKSSMTLFEYVAEKTGESAFSRVLEKYFEDQRDERTLDLLEAGAK